MLTSARAKTIVVVVSMFMLLALLYGGAVSAQTIDWKVAYPDDVVIEDRSILAGLSTVASDFDSTDLDVSLGHFKFRDRMELTRYSGHLRFWVGGAHHGKRTQDVHEGVQGSAG